LLLFFVRGKWIQAVKKHILIIVNDHTDAFELDLIERILHFYDRPFYVMHYKNFKRPAGNAFGIALVNAENKSQINRIADNHIPVICAGYQITVEYLRGIVFPSSNDSIVYGEPYTYIGEVLKKPGLLSDTLGRSVLGSLTDPNDNMLALKSIQCQNYHSLFTSIGCEGKCAYCSYSNIYSGLYKNRDAWRPRSSENLIHDINLLTESGRDKIWLTGHQLFKKDSNESSSLLQMLSGMDKKNRNLKLYFNVSPLHVVHNKEVIYKLSQCFQLFPRLMIDSFDEESLRLFHLEHTNRDAFNAIHFLNELKIHYRISYIFLRPHLTLERLNEELFHIDKLDSCSTHFSREEKLMMAGDIFLSHLKYNPCSVLFYDHPGLENYKDNIPENCFAVLNTLWDSLNAEMHSFISSSNNLLQAVLKITRKSIRYHSNGSHS
jgi:hypothetical protein